MGYYQMGRRLYDPAIGRFMAVDPLFESFPTQSPYAYAFNSPLSWSDPSGLAPEKERKRDRVLISLLQQQVQESIEWTNYIANQFNYFRRMTLAFFESEAYNGIGEYDEGGARIGEGGGGVGDGVENGITTIEFEVADPNCPEDKKKFFVTYDKMKLAEGITEEKIKDRITNAISTLLSTVDGWELLNTGDNVFHIDITKSGSELAEKGKECDWGAWVAGVANFPLPEGCINTSELQCRTDLASNTIYIASEFFDNDLKNQGYIRTSCAIEIPTELYFVLSHELTHRWFSIPGNCFGSSNHENSRAICIDIWNSLNEGCNYYEFILRKR